MKFLTAAGINLPKDLLEKHIIGNLERSDWLSDRAKSFTRVDTRRAYNKAVHSLTYKPGVVQIYKGLKPLRYRLVVVSSICKVISDAGKKMLGLDYACCSELEVDSTGKITSNLLDLIVDVDQKTEVGQTLAMQERIEIEQIVAGADGPVSSKMLASAGMFISIDQPGAANNAHCGFIS